jgi:RecB family exonuclease
MNRYSASKIKTFETCRLQFKLHYIENIEVEKPVSPDTEFGSLIHKAAEIYNGSNLTEVVKLTRDYHLNEAYKREIAHTLRNLFVFSQKYKHVDEKRELEIEWKTDDIWLYGFADKLIDNNQLICIDYKTAKYADTSRFMFQMRLYNLILSHVYQKDPDKIRFVVYFPRIDTEEKILFSKKEIILFESDIRKKITTIESNTDWNPAPGYHCRWCQYCKGTNCDVGKC